MSVHPLTSLTRSFAATCKPETMKLDEIDQLHNAIERVVSGRPTHVDLIALDQLATQLDDHRRKRRFGNTGQLAGQLDFDGNELVA